MTSRSCAGRRCSNRCHPRRSSGSRATASHSASRRGTTIIRERNAGDRVYVIADVTAGGSQAATLGPGSYVGEIALLRDVPRTTTVTASSDVRLLSLERDVFLRTMTGYEPARAAAHSAAEGRLQELRGLGETDAED